MLEKEILHLAADAGFCAAEIIPVEDIVFESYFRKYCEDNLCGNYGVNYSCPPDCGSVGEMKARMRAYSRALVVQSKWPITDYSDSEAIRKAKRAHNKAMLDVIDRMRAEGHDGLMGGASPCTLCERCEVRSGVPCRQPDRRFSCLSAYCIHVKELAERCGMDYLCADGGIAFFGVYAF